VRPRTLKLLEENVGKAIQDIGIANNFPNTIPIDQEIPELTNAMASNWTACTQQSNNYQSEGMAYRMRENLYQLFI
jgi:hypothetical protein